MNERKKNSFSEAEGELFSECIALMQGEIFEALKLAAEDASNSPINKLALYIPTIIDIQDEYDPLNADKALHICLREMSLKLEGIVNENEIVL